MNIKNLNENVIFNKISIKKTIELSYFQITFHCHF